MNKRVRSLVIMAIVFASGDLYAQDSSVVPTEIERDARPWTLEQAQRAFYNARYDLAAAATLEPCAAGTNPLAACELRTAALLFQIRKALGTSADREKAWTQCAVCPTLMADFNAP